MVKPRGSASRAILVLVTGSLLGLGAGPAGAVVLYGISGDGATPASSLFTLDPGTAVATALGALGNGDDGEGIAFSPGDGLLYHSSGGTDGVEYFETVNPDNLALGPNLASGGSYGPSPAREIFALAWHAALGVFLASDVDFNFYHVTPNGQFTLVGNAGVPMRGFAVVGSRVYGVDPYSPRLFEVDPASGQILATLPLSVDGSPTPGNGLATHPETGTVYAILKNPAAPGGGRLLATLDVATGQATSVGNTGLKLAGIAFRSHAPLYAVSGDGASPSSTLFTLDLGDASASVLTSLGNGDDGEGIAFRPFDHLLYHTSGGTDGFEFFEPVDPETLVVGPNRAPAGIYGPDPAGEITALVWYPPLGVFLASDIDFNLYHVTADGRLTLAGNSGVQMRGLAVVGARVYGVSPFSHLLFELDPTNGSILASLPLSVDGLGTTGNGLATSPDTGVVFAIVKNPVSPSGGRLLATLDVSTGAAVSVGETGLKLAGLSFGRLDAPGLGVDVPVSGGAGLAGLVLAVVLAGARLLGEAQRRR